MSSDAARVIEGDCLEVLSHFPAESVDLAYLDPPFNTGRAQQAGLARYADDWPTVAAYLDFMRPRIAQVQRVLKPHGSILLHCDWRCAHHLRLLLDDLFGPNNFVNHLIWCYGLGGSSPRRFARKHDDILFYARGSDYYFDPPMVPATSQRMRGELKMATDVLDIPAINNMATERCGYPTQKPLALLDLLINACCPPGSLVLDPFCGSGTTLIAALTAGRDAVGIDVNSDAVRITRRRLEAMLCAAPT